MYSKEGEDAILTWVKSFPFGAEINSIDELSNGKVMSLICNRDMLKLLIGNQTICLFVHS